MRTAYWQQMPPVLPPDPPLTDGELTLRWRRPADGPALVAILQDPAISRWTRVPDDYGPGDFEAFLVRSEAERLDGDGLSLLVTDADDAIVGSVALHEIRTPRPDIGYWVAPQARGRSVAPRAVRLLRDWAHAELGLQRIEIHVHPDNAASLRAAEKAGFEPTGRMRPSRRDTSQQLTVLAWRAP
jgi:RimJ/RimL family protein N-acetyltransferase